MQKKSKNWPGVQYPLKASNENFDTRQILQLFVIALFVVSQPLNRKK